MRRVAIKFLLTSISFAVSMGIFYALFTWSVSWSVFILALSSGILFGLFTTLFASQAIGLGSAVLEAMDCTATLSKFPLPLSRVNGRFTLTPSAVKLENVTAWHEKTHFELDGSLAVEADGGIVTTVEGLAEGDRLSALQQAFLDHGAAQCGFCIPGQLMAAHALLAEHAHPTRHEIEEGMAGNLCRCACYEQIFEAIEAVAADADVPESVTVAVHADREAGGATAGGRDNEEGLDQ